MARVPAKRLDELGVEECRTYSSAARSPRSKSASNAKVPKSTSASEQPRQSDQASGAEKPKSEYASGTEGPKSWTIIWVHEHCFKPVNAKWKHELELAATSFGARLTCLKKYAVFYQFMEDHGPQHYVLVTDWREVRKCIKFVSVRPHLRLPLLTVVLCGSVKQHNTVLRWAEGNNEKVVGPMSVDVAPESPTQLLSDVVATRLNRSDAPLQFCQGEPPNGLPIPAPPASAIPRCRLGLVQVEHHTPPAATDIRDQAQESPVKALPQGQYGMLSESLLAAMGLTSPVTVVRLSF